MAKCCANARFSCRNTKRVSVRNKYHWGRVAHYVIGTPNGCPDDRWHQTAGLWWEIWWICFSRWAAPLSFVVLPLPTSHCDWTTGTSGLSRTCEICLLKLRSSYTANVAVSCRPRHSPLTVLKFSPEKHNLWLSPEIIPPSERCWWRREFA